MSFWKATLLSVLLTMSIFILVTSAVKQFRSTRPTRVMWVTMEDMKVQCADKRFRRVDLGFCEDGKLMWRVNQLGYDNQLEP